MSDIKEIRRKLWYSLDMLAVKKWFFAGVFLAVVVSVMMLSTPDHVDRSQRVGILIFQLLLFAVPFFGFCLVRTFRIFGHPESYTFCQTKLSQPKGGRIRDTIRFTVLLEDADGNKFAADTNSIFQTHGMSLVLEDYVNQTVTAAYNEETGTVVIIG